MPIMMVRSGCASKIGNCELLEGGWTRFVFWLKGADMDIIFYSEIVAHQRSRERQHCRRDCEDAQQTVKFILLVL